MEQKEIDGLEEMDRGVGVGGYPKLFWLERCLWRGFACLDRGVCPLALCGEMLAPVEEPLYLRVIWADIGGMPPPARRPAVKSTGAVGGGC